MKTFFKGVWSELKKVHWPEKKQIINYTGIVLATCLAFALVISLFDWVVSSLLNLVLSI
ncbi:MAG: preprotein translocase subunit SecE [Firmicutes bacterium]|nr:preprotein translocase subunit SecE [Bacillota bacterium]